LLSGSETIRSNRRIVAVRAPSGIVHDSLTARSTRRTSRVPNVHPDESPKPPGVFAGSTWGWSIKPSACRPTSSLIIARSKVSRLARNIRRFVLAAPVRSQLGAVIPRRTASLSPWSPHSPREFSPIIPWPAKLDGVTAPSRIPRDSPQNRIVKSKPYIRRFLFLPRSNAGTS
jgi:hypothetical protein